jgi:predicted deacylase
MTVSVTSGPTIYTGDVLQETPVISQLNLNDLEPGRMHRFFFQGVQMGTGQYWYVPVMVAKGRRAGKRICLSAGVHGDELSPLDTLRRIMAALDPERMSGAVMAVCGISRPAIESIRPHWPTAQSGGLAVDINRVWPGDEEGENAPTRQAGILWQRLFKNNIDVTLDYHTVSTGSDFTLFLFADFRQSEVQQIAQLFPCEQIKNDPGLKGTLETAFIEAGIPALTIEIGAARRFDTHKIELAVEGSLNVLKHYQVIEDPLGRTAKEAGTFFGDTFETIRATAGGFLELQVDLKDPVRPGQPVAIQRNAFGDIVATYTAGVFGQVAVIARDALCEPGGRVMQILYVQQPEMDLKP